MSFTWQELEQMQPRGQWSIPVPPTCRKCDYNLTGLPEDRCPECGTPFTWAEVRKRAAHTWALTLRLKYANQDATTGIILALAGWFTIGFVHLLGATVIALLVDMLAMFVAVLAVILGAQVLNIRRVPLWAREYFFKPPPSLLLGLTAMLLGFSLLIGAILVG